MPPTRRNEDGLLARVNFPLYSVKMLTPRHIIVAGGGGSSKTGVANGFEIYELSHNGKRYTAEEVVRHETGPSVVMNCACYSNGRKSYLVAGQESHCQLYSVNAKIVEEEIVLESERKDSNHDGVRHRKNSEKAEKEETKLDPNSNSTKHLKFEIKPSDSIQTDFSKDEPFQRVVRIGCSGKLMVTGGTDGHIRLWAFPSLRKKIEISGHSKEIDDLDISHDEEMVVSIAKDGRGYIWDCSTGKKIGELQWETPNNVKYLYKKCRFGISENLKSRLFTLSNPAQRPTKAKSYLQLWDPLDVSLKKCVSCPEFLSALSVSDDGKFVAIGTMYSGSVSVYVAFSLQKVLHVNEAHTMFVTGLEFLPTEESALTSSTETAVVSISVDNRICIHDLAYRRSIPFWLAIVFIVITLFFTLLLCSFLGL